MRTNPEVTAYLENAPADQQPLLKRLRRAIRAALPHAEEVLESKMPVYKIEGNWTVGFATRKQAPMFYCMRTHVLDQFEAEIKGLRTGKSCVALKPSLKNPEDLVTRILAAIQQLETQS